MSQLLTLLLAASTLFFFSCKGSEKTPASAKSAPEEMVLDKSCPDLEIEQGLYAQINPEGVQIKEANISKHTLYLRVQFSGCPSDELTIAWNGLLKKSYPGKATFRVGLLESGMCEAIQSRELCVNIHSLASNKKVIISLNDQPEGLLYSVLDE